MGYNCLMRNINDTFIYIVCVYQFQDYKRTFHLFSIFAVEFPIFL